MSAERLARRGALLGAAVMAALVCAFSVGGTSRAGPAATPATATTARSEGPVEPEPTRYLRQLAFDLTGAPPSMEDLEEVAREGKVTDARIDAMLRARSFLTQVRAWHAAMLWPNVDGFVHANAQIRAVDYPDNGQYSPYPELVAHPERHREPLLLAERALDFRGRTLCDAELEYPEPAEHGPQPTYAVVGSDGVRRTYPYYDPNGVVLPYHDAAHCPNYCSSKTDAERSAPGFDGLVHWYTSMSADGADASPAELDPPNKHCPKEAPHRVVNACDGHAIFGEGDDVFGLAREGFAWRSYYWTLGKRLKVCARDAQTRVASVLSGDSCGQMLRHDPSCGCGPDGIYCAPSWGRADVRSIHDTHAGVDGEPLEIFAQVVDHDEDYFGALTTRRSFVTGPLAAYYRSLTSDAFTDYAPPVAASELPDVPYSDETWHEYVRGPEHSGVLTTMAYLLRFPTGRSRVSQFRTQFMCRPFTPTVAALPGADDTCTREQNLAHRCGCKACHTAIEPMTAWFGRWGERTARYLSDRDFPLFDARCQSCVPTHDCTGRCVAYALDAIDVESEPFAGMLRGAVYRTPDERARIDEGPRGLVESALASGELESCTVRTAWANLVGRPMTDDELARRLPALERDFDAHGHSYRALIRAVVTSPEYRSLE